MGFSHYWTVKRTISKKNRVLMRNFAVKAIELSDATIGNWEGEGKPSVNEREIRFNGVGDDSHETFTLMADLKDNYSGQDGYRFCKTARKPYDEVVVACLMEAEHLGVIKGWSSDGDTEDHEDGQRLFDMIHNHETKELTMDEKRQALAEGEFDALSHGDMLELLLEGCTGYNNMPDEEIEEQYSYIS